MRKASEPVGRNEEKRPNAVGGKRPGLPKNSRNKDSALSKKFKLIYDTYENVNKQGKELLDNWKYLLEENDKALKTAFKKQKNMTKGKLSENKLRKEIEREINIAKKDKRLMKKSLDSVQQYIKDLMHQLRLQRKFLMDNEKVIKCLFSDLENNKRPRIQNPFPKTVTDMKKKFQELFTSTLLITPEERQDANKRPSTADNTMMYEGMLIFDGRIGRVNVMSPLAEDKMYKCHTPDILVVDKCTAGECNDAFCSCHRSQSELSYIKLEMEMRELYAKEDSEHKNKESTSKCTPDNSGKNVKSLTSRRPSRIPRPRIPQPLDLTRVRLSPRSMSAPQKQTFKVNNMISGSVSSESTVSKLSQNLTIHERKYIYSKLHIIAMEECYIPKTAHEKVNFRIWQRFCSMTKDTDKSTETDNSHTPEVINMSEDNTTLTVANCMDKPTEGKPTLDSETEVSPTYNKAKEIPDAKLEAVECSKVKVKEDMKNPEAQPKSAQWSNRKVPDVFPAPDYPSKLTGIEIKHVDLKPYSSDMRIAGYGNNGKDKKTTLKTRIKRCLSSLLPSCLKKIKKNSVHPECVYTT